MEELLPLQSHAAEALQPFDERVIAFLDRLSHAVLKDPSLNRIAEFASLGFWLRKANISKYVNENNHLIQNKNFVTAPAGIVFHVCPSNVDTMFMYSLAISLLMGNRNLLRVSGRQGSPHLDTLFDVINTVMRNEENKLFSECISIFTYEHDHDISSFFSLHANVRVIWGGDSTIEVFKKIPVSPRTKDIVFADRVSYALFMSKEYALLSEEGKNGLAHSFYNDSYSFNQKGCSCPQTIFTVGSKADNEAFEKNFYERLKNVVVKKYDADIMSLASLKLNRLADDATAGKISQVMDSDNRVVFARLNDGADASGTCGGGLFYIRSLENLADLLSWIHPKVQTVSYFGLKQDDIHELVKLSSGKGIDRLVPIGKALDFHYLWDGYNLFDELCIKRSVI